MGQNKIEQVTAPNDYPLHASCLVASPLVVTAQGTAVKGWWIWLRQTSHLFPACLHYGFLKSSYLCGFLVAPLSSPTQMCEK
jgi:hypothetical protein